MRLSMSSPKALAIFLYQNLMQINGARTTIRRLWNTGGSVMGVLPCQRRHAPAVEDCAALTRSPTISSWLPLGVRTSIISGCLRLHAKYPQCRPEPGEETNRRRESAGVSLKLADNSPKSAIDGMPKFVRTAPSRGLLCRQYDCSPPISRVQQAAKDGDPALADPGPTDDATTADGPDDRRSAFRQGYGWGGMAAPGSATLDGTNASPAPIFQYHHQPFNYFRRHGAGQHRAAEHLRDGGLAGVEFIKAIDARSLPQVSFYKPQGNLNEHPGYRGTSSSVTSTSQTLLRFSCKEPAMEAHAGGRDL